MKQTIPFHVEGVRMIAHRGLSGLELQNTNAAFVAAANRSYFGIETDIHVTKDGCFAVIHDDTTENVSDTVLTVEESTLAELRALSLRKKDGETRGDLIVPTLSEYAAICRDYGKVSVLELKNPFEKADIERVVAILKEMDQFEHTIFISFCFDNLVRLREVDPTCNVQYLRKTVESVDELLAKAAEHHFDLDLHSGMITKELVSRAHELGILINVWTVDSTDTAKRVAEAGVDFITTNILE